MKVSKTWGAAIGLGLPVILFLASIFIPEVRNAIGLGEDQGYTKVTSVIIPYYGEPKNLRNFGISYIRANPIPGKKRTDYDLGLEVRIEGSAKNHESVVDSDYVLDYHWNGMNYRLGVISINKKSASIDIAVYVKE